MRLLVDAAEAREAQQYPTWSPAPISVSFLPCNGSLFLNSPNHILGETFTIHNVIQSAPANAIGRRWSPRGSGASAGFVQFCNCGSRSTITYHTIILPYPRRPNQSFLEVTMLRQLRSRLQKGLYRHSNVRDHEGYKDNEQGGYDVRAITVSPASLEHKDATQTTIASIETSQPAALPESASPKEFHAAISTSARPLPTASANNFTKIRTPTGVDDAPISLPAQLWDRAYNEVKREEMELVDIYEKILSRQLQGGPGLAVPDSQPNIIAQNNSDRRRCQMTQLIYAGLDRIEREAKVKEGLGVAVDVALSAKNIINSAVHALPQAALAWTGICVALEVRLS